MSIIHQVDKHVLDPLTVSKGYDITEKHLDPTLGVQAASCPPDQSV